MFVSKTKVSFSSEFLLFADFLFSLTGSPVLSTYNREIPENASIYQKKRKNDWKANVLVESGCCIFPSFFVYLKRD